MLYDRFDVSVRTVKATPYVPANHLIVRKTLTDNDFTLKIISKLPERMTSNEHRTFSTFVNVKVVNNDTYNSNNDNDDKNSKEKNLKDDKDESEMSNEKKVTSSAMKTRSRERQDKSESELLKSKRSFSEQHVLVEWSDGSYATVGSACGRLTRYASYPSVLSSISFIYLLFLHFFFLFYSLLFGMQAGIEIDVEKGNIVIMRK
jgi:hypothetical protein